MSNQIITATAAQKEAIRKQESKTLIHDITQADDVVKKNIAFMLRQDAFGTGPRNAEELFKALDVLYGLKIGYTTTSEEWTSPFEWVYANYFNKYEQILGVAPRGSGKALCLKTPIPTPTGWKTMGELQVGDYVFDEQGSPTRVTFVTETLYDRPCYEVEFTDGTKIVADAEHLWEVESRNWRDTIRRYTPNKPRPVITTEEIADKITVSAGKNRRDLNYNIRLTKPVQYEEKEQPIDPYIFGLWLGDGSKYFGAISTADQEILDSIQEHYEIRHKGQYDYTVYGLQAGLSKLGVLLNKHIPDCYLYGSVEQRIALLQGLMDSDGTANKTGQLSVGFSNNVRLIEQTQELILSLGVKAKVTQKRAKLYDKDCGIYYRINFVAQFPAFRLSRKLARQNLALDKKCKYGKNGRFIKAVTPVESVPVKCITVDSPNHLYLCSRSFIPTHNTLVASAFTHLKCAHLPGFEAVHFGARKVQAKVARQYLHNYGNDDVLKVGMDPRGVLQEKANWISNGSRWHIVAGTMAGVSGQHPNMLSIDEIEFLDDLTLEQAWAVPMERNGYKRLWTGFSTRQRPSSVMTKLVQDAESGKRNIKLMQWSAFETMRPCPSCLCIKGGNVVSEPEKACPLWKYCIEGTQYIQTVNRGAVPIKDLRKNELVYTWCDNKLHKRKVLDVWSNGMKPTITLTTSSRKQLCLTVDHPVLVAKRTKTTQGRAVKCGQPRVDWKYEWVRAGDVQIDDLVCTIKDIGPKGIKAVGGVELTNDLLEFIGAFLGDGYLSQWKIGMCEFNPEKLKVMDRVAAAFGASVPSRTPYGITIHSVALANALRSLGLGGKRSYEKTLPEWVWQLSKAQFYTLLSGYISADGYRKKPTEARPGVSYSVYSTSRTMLRQVRNLLAMHGQSGVGKVLKYARGDKPIFIKGVEVKSVKQMYTLEVHPNSKRGVKSVYNNCPSLNKFLPLDTQEFQLEKIITIEEATIAEVFDMTVEDDHNFIAEGIVVHNCQGERAMRSTGWMTRESVVNLMETMTTESFETQMLCLRPTSHGLVLHNFVQDYATAMDLNKGNFMLWQYQPDLPVYVFHDPCENHKSAMLLVQVFNGRVFGFDEIVDESGPTISKVKMDLEDLCRVKGYGIPKAVIVDPRRTDIVKQWREGSAGGEGAHRSFNAVVPVMRNGMDEIEAGLELLRSYVRNGLGEVRFYLNPRTCPKHVTAVTLNSYKLNKTNELIEGAKQEAKYKDEVDEVRYGIIYLHQQVIRTDISGFSF